MENEINERAFLSAFLSEGVYLVDHVPEQVETEDRGDRDHHMEEVETIEIEHSKPIDFLGENKKSVAIIVTYEADLHIPVKDKMVLDRVLAAVNLSYDDIAMINLHHHQINQFEELHSILNNRVYIGFGLKREFFGQMKLNSLESFDTSKILFLDFTITQMAMSKDKKMVLWKNMKEIFGL